MDWKNHSGHLLQQCKQLFQLESFKACIANSITFEVVFATTLRETVSGKNIDYFEIKE